jgi:Na+-translocating ferredoxin:NAD+ oxidoreductase RnfD subunit
MIRRFASLARDPRYYQVAVLSLLLMYGLAKLDFPVTAANALVIVAAALGTQWIAGRLVGLPRFDPLSALITSLSLTLLLRTDSLSIAGLSACIAIASKFLIRVNGKHIFNPANFALVILSFTTPHAWLSSGQWGNTTLLAFGFACLGFLVLTRAKRAETTIAFLGSYASLLLGRTLWLGDPLSIPLHQLQSGALLLFAFFMISDPKTTPDHALGRICYGLLVATTAFGIQFVLHEPHGPIIALILCSPCVPLIDRLLAGRRYAWHTRAGKKRPVHKGVVT